MNDPYYTRKPENEILYLTKDETKSLIMARYGMLECGKNMKGTIPEICNECLVPDDENHRLNCCKKWTRENRDGAPCDFCDIYSDNPGTVDGIIDEVEKVWETRYANGRMKRI